MMVSVSHVDLFAAPLAAWDELEGGESLEGDAGPSASAPRRHTRGASPSRSRGRRSLHGDTVLRDITPNAIVDEDPERPGEAFRSVSRYFETLDSIRTSNAASSLLTGTAPPFQTSRPTMRK